MSKRQINANFLRHDADPGITTAITSQVILPAVLWLPVVAFVFRLLDVAVLAFLYKAVLVAVFAGMAWRVLPRQWRILMVAVFCAYGLWAVMRFGLLGGSLPSFLGAFAYASLLAVWLAPRLSLTPQSVLHHGIAILTTLLILGLFWGQSRFVEPWANPNTFALCCASLMFFVIQGEDCDWRTWLFLALAGLLLALLLSRSALLVVDLLLMARLLRAYLRRQGAAFWFAVWVLCLAITAYVFWGRGDFLAQQFGEGGRVDIAKRAWDAIYTESKLYPLIGLGFGTATNAFTNLKDQYPAALPFVQGVPTFFGGLDNTFAAALVNGGLPWVLIVTLAFFGWLVRVRDAPWQAWIEAGCLAAAVLVQLISLNMPEVWPPVVLWLLALWRWRPVGLGGDKQGG